jgi:hypothetical protein
MAIEPNQAAPKVARQPQSRTYDRMWGRILHDERIAGASLL